jgi:hypothetical protein
MVQDNCLALPLAVAQSLLLQDLEDYRRSQRLNNNDRKQEIKTTNKTVYQAVPKY